MPRLLRGIIPNHDGGFDCLNCFYLYRTKETLKKHKKVCKDHDYCFIQMPDEDKKILKYNPGEKSLKASFIVYTDLRFKISSNKNN